MSDDDTYTVPAIDSQPPPSWYADAYEADAARRSGEDQDASELRRREIAAAQSGMGSIAPYTGGANAAEYRQDPDSPTHGAGRDFSVELHHPEGDYPGRDAMDAIIDTIEQWMQTSVDLLGSGDYEAVDLAELLTSNGLVDPGDATTSEMFTNYRANVDDLEDVQSDLRNRNHDVEIIPREEISPLVREARRRIEAVVDDLNETLQAADQEMIGPGDSYFNEMTRARKLEVLDVLFEAVTEVENLIQDVSSEVERQREEIDGRSPEHEAAEADSAAEAAAGGAEAAARDAESAAAAAQAAAASGDYDDYFGDDSGERAADDDFVDLYDDVDGTGDFEGLLDDTGDSVMEPDLSPAVRGGGGVTGPDSPVSAVADGANAHVIAGQGVTGSSGGDPWARAMPLMLLTLSQALLRNNRQDGASSGSDDSRQDLRDRRPPEAARAPDAGDPAATDIMPVVTALDPGIPPVVVPGSMVDLVLPDGSTQKVPSVVAQAVQKELSNPNGSDARAAYMGTTAAPTPGHPWSMVDTANQRIGSSELRTGDVVQWTNRTALVVVTDNGLHYITSGQLVPLDPHNPQADNHGAYGDFEGYFRPSGIDIHSAPVEPVQTAAPQVAATAQPPPLVTPPVIR
ncbi:hypothetical protein [Nocardia araoensis]|uniref:hypothetical protein n=1 Tax=Nocardia araoensis TaxID=228600 RepID=UPI0005854E1B|nr:hypothetical protein [Nocardia araoensis]